jgi:hypothetical protein
MGQNPGMATKDDPSDGRQDVLTSLPHARPTRRSAKRDIARSGATANAGSDGEAKPAGQRAPKRTKRATTAAERGGAASSGAAPDAPPRPRPQVPPAGYATQREDAPAPMRRGELVSTAVEAVGELAQFGVTAGLHGLRSALRRLPRP